MVSTDTIGWTTYNYEINNDISIQLDSNFGYGRSSYFLLSLRYKGIEIYPVSEYVKYPYANMRTLIGHTRTYRVDRMSWQDALEFVAETANYAMRFPRSFVDKFILGEIQEMMEGLRNILYKENLYDPVKLTLTRPQYLGVSVEGICNSKYTASSGEMLLVQKSERIIGVLAVLEKLKTLDTIVKNIDESIREIIAMVNKLLPELVNGIKRVEAELLACEFEAGCLDSFYRCACVEFEKHKRVLQNMENETLNKHELNISPYYFSKSIPANSFISSSESISQV